MKKSLLSILFFSSFCLSSVVVADGDDAVAEVSIKKFQFIPKEITVKVGTTIRWANDEKRQYHSVWFKQAGEAASDYFFPGETYEKNFNKVGTFPYTCEPHPKIVSVVHVVE